MLFRVFDTETTGLPVKGEPNKHQIIELGYTDVLKEGDYYRILPGKTSFVQAETPVDIEARATHHITDEEIAGGISQADAIAMFLEGDPDYFVAHNIEFDRQFLPVRDDQALCTLKAATHAWEDAPRHSNGVLRYYLDFNQPKSYRPYFDVSRSMPAHRAQPDTYVTAFILIELLQKFSPGELMGFTLQPRKIIKWPMGQFFGKLLTDPCADLGYFRWVIGKADMDPDLVHACKLEMQRRTGR